MSTADDGTEDLRTERRGHALWLTIDRPARRNAMSAAVLSGLSAGLARAAADDDIRVVVVTGAGDQAFCAGADLSKGSGSFQFDPSRPHYANPTAPPSGRNQPSRLDGGARRAAWLRLISGRRGSGAG